jgi:hypothetical protein
MAIGMALHVRHDRRATVHVRYTDGFLAYLQMNASGLTPRMLLGVHVLPFLHLSGCFVIALAHLDSAWGYMFLVDAPASVFVLALAYNHDRPLLLFGIIGTLWWYLLSYAAAFFWLRVSIAIRRRRDSSLRDHSSTH